MAENINLKYKIPKVTLSETTESDQSYIVEYREVGQEPFNTHPRVYVVNPEGENINEFSFEGLEDDTEYEVRLTNTLGGDPFMTSFRTGLSITIGDSPLWMKKLYPGQTIDFYEPGLLSSSLPANYQGYLFIFEQNYRDGFAGFANAEPQNGMGFKVAQNSVNQKKYSGIYMNGTRYVALNNTHPTLASRVNAAQMFDYDGSKSYSLWLWIYNESSTGNSKPILTTGDTQNNYRIMLVGGFMTVTVTRDGVTETLTSDSALQNDNWYLLEIRRNVNNPNWGVVFLHGDAGNIGFTPNFLTTSPNAQDAFTVYIGYDNLNSVVADGLIVRRVYFGINPDLDNNSRYRLMYPEDYLPRLVFSKSGGIEFVVSTSWQLKLDDAVFSTTIDPAIPPDTYTMFIRTPSGEVANKEIELVGFQKETTGFDINLADSFDNNLNLFKEKFCALHSQWGGANGGVNGNLIYADRAKQTLIFEVHGDLYDGSIVGVRKPPNNSTTQGYGVPHSHDIPQDPKYGEPWKERVGAVAVSLNYYGFGEWSTWMKVPTGAYGFSPALWFFHYQEIYPTDERWPYWISRGAKPYGGADPYMVINHEIDMELPSHLTQGVFAEWNEVSNAYFDPLALDDQYHIAVEDTTNPANYGLFRLTNPNLPNLRASWIKVDDTWDVVSTPKMSNCKFNNWIGEKSSGNGWAYTEPDYDGEEYLALLTKLDQNYADDQFHKWTIKWYPDRTELWIDDEYIRSNRAFVPSIPGRITLGGWFPSGVSSNSAEPWKYTPARAWAGYPADFKTLNLEIQRISYTPYPDSGNELFSETYPEAGLRTLI